MRILLTLFCILPLTIDTAFAAPVKWLDNYPWTDIAGGLETICKHKETTEGYEKTETDTTGGFCMPCGRGGTIISECGYLDDDNLDELQLPVTNPGNNERMDKICMCRRIYPLVTKWRRADVSFDSVKKCNEGCYNVCQNYNFNNYCAKYKQEGNFDGYEVDCDSGSVYLNRTNSLYEYGTYSGSNTAVIELTIAEISGTKWISPTSTTTYKYYHSIEDDTGTYHCVDSSISGYDPNGANENIVCDSE